MGLFSKIFSKRKIIKTLSGAAGGFLAGGPVGAIAGGATGMLSGGKGKVLKNFMMGATVGGVAGYGATQMGWQNGTSQILGRTFTPLSTRVANYVGSGPTMTIGDKAVAMSTHAGSVASAAANLQGKAPEISADEAATQASFTRYTDLFNKGISLMSSADEPPRYDTSRGAPPSSNILPLALLGGAALFLVYA